jgi:hypothetical protein
LRISDYEPESQGRRAIRQAGISTGSESVTDPWLEIGIPQEPRASKLQDGLEASLLAWAAALPGPLFFPAWNNAVLQPGSIRGASRIRFVAQEPYPAQVYASGYGRTFGLEYQWRATGGNEQKKWQDKSGGILEKYCNHGSTSRMNARYSK